MRISICVGNYAKTPYSIPGLEVNVFSMEELCYALKEDAYLLDDSIMNDSLLDWIDRECGLRELTRTLYPLIHKRGTLSSFVNCILSYVGIFDENTVKAMDNVLKQGAGLNLFERKKKQIDFMVQKGKYHTAIMEYDILISRWKECEKNGEIMPSDSCLAAIIHNQGVAFSQLMVYGVAATLFMKAFQLDNKKEYYFDYMAAKRMELSEEDYIAFAAEQAKQYPLALELEKKIENLMQDWEISDERQKLISRRELKEGVDRQKYFQESERLTQQLKSKYRNGNVY